MIPGFFAQVEPNAHRLEEHRRKYERLRKEREEKKIAHERQRRRAEAQVTIFYALFLANLASQSIIPLIEIFMCIFQGRV